MRFLFTIVRSFIAAILTLPLAASAAAVHLLPGKRKRRALASLTMFWGGLICRIMGINIHISGEYEHAPGGMIISNHVSWVDIFVIASLRPCVFVSKKEVKYWPVMGQLAWLADTMFLERDSKRASVILLSEVEEAAASGVSVVVFPEGTSTDGTYILPFKCMFFEVPAKTGIPVIPVSLVYSIPDVPWYGGMTFPPHLMQVLGIRRFDVSLHFGKAIARPAGIDARSARKSLCADTEYAVREGLSAAKENLPKELSATSPIDLKTLVW